GLQAERIHERGGRIGHCQHVRSLYALPASDRGAIKAKTLLKTLLAQFADGATEMLPSPKRIDEFDVHHFRAILARHVHYGFCVRSFWAFSVVWFSHKLVIAEVAFFGARPCEPQHSGLSRPLRVTDPRSYQVNFLRS